MPELPEIETIRRDLTTVLLDNPMVGMTMYDRRLMSVEEEKRWKAIIPGQRWQRLSRKGKYLWVELANGWKILFHLRMTGQLIVRAHSGAPLHLRLSLHFADGRVLELRDQRRFAEVKLIAPGETPASNLGPDALTELSLDQFVLIVKGRTTRIHPLLLDQRLLSGVGNIYAQEALFKARVRPTRPGCRVTKLEASRLFASLQETLQTAITHRGSSSRNYRDAYGEAGSAQTLHSVYRKGGTPCPRCHGILRATRVGGRGCVYCPRCQK